TQTVLKPATLTITSVSNSNGVTINAKVAAKSPATGQPTGTVSFFEAGVLLGTVNLNTTGNASIFLALSSGNHTIVAVYSGDSDFATVSKSQVVAGKITGRLV